MELISLTQYQEALSAIYSFSISFLLAVNCCLLIGLHRAQSENQRLSVQKPLVDMTIQVLRKG